MSDFFFIYLEGSKRFIFFAVSKNTKIMKKYFSSPKILVIDLGPENEIISSSTIEHGMRTQSVDDDDSQKAHSRGGIWDDM